MTVVNRIRAALLLAILLTWAASPALACMLPGAAPTTAERECCHHMAERCGQAVMPASHSCCQNKSHSPDALPQASASVPIRHLVIAIAALPVTFVTPAPVPEPVSAYLHSPPPGKDHSSVSILRI